MSNRNQMPGLRLKGNTWYVEKRCKHAEGGWLRESTGTSRRAEAERYLIRRLAQLEDQAYRAKQSVYLFEEAALRYLEDIAHKSSADDVATHLDQLAPFVGQLPLEQIHDGTLRPFIQHELGRGIAPKSINNVIGYVSTILNRAARAWRNQEGQPWLRLAPPLLTRLSVKGKQRVAYPLSWEEQDRFFALLPDHLRPMAVFGVNTGCREQEICQLRWEWEVPIPDLGVSVFVLPEWITKTGAERTVILNSASSQVIEAQRGKHDELVFTYRGEPLKKLHTSAWKRAWSKAGLPAAEKYIQKGVHNLRHTCGRRLRAARVPVETRKALIGHANGDITTHYSAVELWELMQAAEALTDRSIAQTPALHVIARTASQRRVGKVSETKKGLAVNVR